MTADELANYLDDNVDAWYFTEQKYIDEASSRLREQAKYIAQLECENEFLKDWRDTWSPFIKQQCGVNNDMTQECVAKTEK